MMGFAVVVGASLVSSLNLTINLILGFTTSFSLTAASMVINDFYDREIDAINEPERPIPKGVVTPTEALIFAFILSIFGLITAFSTNIPSLVLAAVAWIISITYITEGKSTGLFGNFLVSATVVIPFIYGGLAVGQLKTSALIFVAIAFFSNTAREMTKGIVDIEGDKSHGINTIAVKYGEKLAAILATIFFLVSIFLSPLPWIWSLVSDLFIPFVIITDLGIVISCILLLQDHSRQNAKRIKNLSLVWFITGLLAFIFGSF
jgi:geranylgeranylglycerol-phosphate geranylgeranyltransferase